MGALMYDRAHPGQVDGLVLLAPYLGEPPLMQEIKDAGGLSKWNAGPVPAHVDNNNFQRELWRYLQGWSRDRARTRTVWLAYGDRDPLRAALPLLAPLLPPSHVLVRSGGHAWTVWTPAAHEILAAADSERHAQSAP